MKKSNQKRNKAGKLYLVPTPLSPSQQEFLLPGDAEKVRKLKRIFAENPKTARAFLKLLNPETPIQEIEIYTFDEHTRDKAAHELIRLLSDGVDTGMMTEAGVPAVADPGSRLVRLAHMKNIEVVPMIGPSSILLALMASGLNGQKFCFDGYLPVDQNKREDVLRALEADSLKSATTHIIIETPYRNRHLWNSMLNVCHPNCELSIAVNLGGQDQYIKTAKVGDWKNIRWPDLDRKQAVFLLNSKATIK
ncbi:MAG: SAM-dependent methyltransferase [Candidatus Dojkabacteria bacterium]|nr:MAG: SAM-dependent methyltransferase [Candidatus Dojkabacteria bacterium]